VSTTTESVVFNGLPLLLLAGAYLAVAGSLVPAVWRERRRADPLEVAIATIFPAVAFAAALLGVLVLHDRRPLGGHVWICLAAIVIAFAPLVLFAVRWRERDLLAGGVRRARDAEALLTLRDREIGSLASISAALARAHDLETAALPLIEQVQALLAVEFCAVVLVDEDATTATGVLGRLGHDDLAWWRELRLDLRNEPSAIASTVFEGASIVVYDVQNSQEANPRLRTLTGVKSGVWVPIIAEERVVGVLMAATTGDYHAFTTEETALLETLAGEVALALERMRSADALSVALGREQSIAEIARAVRGERDVDALIRVASQKLHEALALDHISIDVEDNRPKVTFERAVPLDAGEKFLLETVTSEIGFALETARLLSENQLRIEQQSALLLAAKVVASELELESVLERLVGELRTLLRVDAADCYLLDPQRRMLQCAAVNGFDESLVGFECDADNGAAGLAVQRERPVAVDSYDDMEHRVPHDAYRGFAHALVAPMVWGGEVRGVLGVGMRAGGRSFVQGDIDVLETFAGLASLALRNAESFAERGKQARVERAFSRIAALLSGPVSLTETLDAAAHAACETLGGDFAAVLMSERGRLSLAGAHQLPESLRSLEPPPALVDAVADTRIVVAARIQEDERFGGEWRGEQFASLLAIPVEGGGLVIVFFAEPRAFAADDLELARHVATATRAALERSRAFESERMARALSQQLARTGSTLATELDPLAVLDEVVGQATALLGADAGSVAMLEEGELVISATSGAGVDDAIRSRAPSTGWLGGDVVQLRAPVAREDVSADTLRADADAVVAQGFRAYLGVPLAGPEGALHGVLAVYMREPRVWREEEIEALGALATNASVALANAELYQRLALEHEQSIAILSNVADGIVAVDRESRVVVWNAAAARITGVPATEALGRTPFEVLKRDLESETGGTNRLVSIMRGSQEVWLSLSEALMRDPADAVAGRIFAFRDISAERVVDQMRSDFVTTVSHELRTPLTSIYGFAETLLRRDIGFSDEERETFLGYIASESERLTGIVDALLNVARLDSGTLQVDLVATDIGEVLNEAVSESGAPAMANGHKFVVDLEDGVPAVRADPDKLRQVISQLVENAVKYSPAGAVVRVEARKHPDSVEITVTDVGDGIPDSQIDRVFEKFYRGSLADPGTGLGLFIAQGLVSAMGGKIWVRSEEGTGSRFTFALPVA
jgi:two-component system, OmpR family, phosphate regulon sensor histidine kinase PhoR